MLLKISLHFSHLLLPQPLARLYMGLINALGSQKGIAVGCLQPSFLYSGVGGVIQGRWLDGWVSGVEGRAPGTDTRTPTPETNKKIRRARLPTIVIYTRVLGVL